MNSHQTLSTIKAAFDEAWYVSAYQDVADSGLSAWDHYKKVGLPLGRPSYNQFHERPDKKINQNVDFSRILVNSERQTAAPRMVNPESSGPRLVIVICYYKHPELAQRMLDAFIQIQDEISRLNTELFIVNDSPEDQGLNEVLESYQSKLSALDLTIVKNEKNLGFIKSSNIGMRYAVEKQADVLLLNSDAILYPGTVEELRTVAYIDPMIGFVSPRSNNATICTLQLATKSVPDCIQDFHEKFTVLRPRLPRFTFAPTVVGFCMYAKGVLLSDIGNFDEIYGMGYNEENDLVMRANRMGYRAVIANHCAAWHDGESSFGNTSVSRLDRDRVNRNILTSRYPEYNKLVDRYFISPEFRAERIFVEAFKEGQKPLKIAFDLCNVGEYHNGTFEAAKRIIGAADRSWPESVLITCYISQRAMTFHGFKDSRRLKFVESDKLSNGAHAIIRIGQPFSPRDIQRLFENAPVVGVFMLDTISWDCGYLANDFDERVWRFVFQWSDFIFTNSNFTRRQILNRFSIGAQTTVVPLLHSTNTEEYLPAEGNSTKGAPPVLPPDFLMIVGNKFHHKGTESAARHLATALPDSHFVVLGSMQEGLKNVTSIDSGSLSDASINQLYAECSIVIFPSHYEGFGFPVLHALARKKPIFVRSSPLYSELAMHTIGGTLNIHQFTSLETLSYKLHKGLPFWHETESGPKSVSWIDSAITILDCIESRLKETQALEIVERLRSLDHYK